jgi:hypothetical protein
MEGEVNARNVAEQRYSNQTLHRNLLKVKTANRYTFTGLEIGECAVKSTTERHEISERRRLEFY